MKCPKCGSHISSSNKVCTKCGYKADFGGNTEFYKKAATSKLTLKDIFSDVFKAHNKKDGERMFIAGTSLSTPNENEMLREWRKPWLFAWVGIFGFIFILLMYFISLSGGEVMVLVPFIFAGALVIPLAVLLFFWEMNIPRNIPLYNVISMLFIGGALSLIFTLIMNSIVGEVPAFLAPLTEEPAKLLALCVFLHKPKNKYILNGLLIGAAIGTGFDAMESMGYALRADNYIADLIGRGISSPGGHMVWAAMYGAALAMVKGSGKLEIKHFADRRFLSYFGIAFLLHYLWNNSSFNIMYIPLFGDIKYVLLIVAAWIAILSLIKKGIQQVLDLSIVPIGSSNLSAGQPSMLMGTSGAYKNNSFPLSGNRLVFGRDINKVNIVFSKDTPGISSIHCEIKNDGQKIILIDRESSYGTFLSNGTKLVPNKAYVLSKGDKFYLANKNNQFEIM